MYLSQSIIFFSVVATNEKEAKSRINKYFFIIILNKRKWYLCKQILKHIVLDKHNWEGLNQKSFTPVTFLNTLLN